MRNRGSEKRIRISSEYIFTIFKYAYHPMKDIRQVLVFLIISAFITPVFSQSKKGIMKKTHKVVMQVTEGDSLTQLAVIGQMRNIKKELPDASIEVVCHANSLDMLLKRASKVSSHIAALSLQSVTFIACENSMARKRVSAEDLVPEVGRCLRDLLSSSLNKKKDGHI